MHRIIQIFNKLTLIFDLVRTVKKLLLFLCLFSCVSSLKAQSGMTFDEFKERLAPYFAEELIEDVHSNLPQNFPYKIWGWDVGDFSGDGISDLAFSLKIAGEKERVVKVYLFADIDGFLTNVGTYSYPFVEAPIEVGIAVKNNGCFVTKKHKRFHWTIDGYRFDNGVLVSLDSFETEQEDSKRTLETYRNYQTLEYSEKERNSRSGRTEAELEYLLIPSYRQGRTIFKGFPAETESNSIRFVGRGAYYWSGEQDCSFRVRSEFSDTALTFYVRVHDDVVIGENNFSSASDHVELWFDAADFQKISGIDTKDTGLLHFVVKLGNFIDKKPSISDPDGDISNEFLAKANVTVRAADSGYSVKISLPWALLGVLTFSKSGVSSDVVRLGCTIVVCDADNEFRPEEETFIGTSPINREQPQIIGELLLIPDGARYGEVENIFEVSISKRLRELGL